MIKKTSLNYASEYECSKLPKVEGPSQTNIEIQTQMQMQIQIQINIFYEAPTTQYVI